MGDRYVLKPLIFIHSSRACTDTTKSKSEFSGKNKKKSFVRMNYLSLGQWLGNVQSWCGLMRKPQDRNTELGVRVPTTSWRGLRERALPTEVTCRLIPVTQYIFMIAVECMKMTWEDDKEHESIKLLFFSRSAQILPIFFAHEFKHKPNKISFWDLCVYVYMHTYMGNMHVNYMQSYLGFVFLWVTDEYESRGY